MKAESRGMIRRGPAAPGLSLPIAPALLQPLRVSLGVTSPLEAGPSLRQDGTQLGGETPPGLYLLAELATSSERASGL